MRSILIQIFGNIIKLHKRDHSLRSSALRRVIEKEPHFIEINANIRTNEIRESVNTLKGSLYICLLSSISCLLLYTNVNQEFITKKLRWLCFFKFSKDEYAYDLVSDTLGAEATIIGLSFVLIIFLFESVKNRTQSTYEVLFRKTNIYLAFSVSMVSLMTIVFLNIFKYKVSGYVAGNYAIYCSLLLLMTSISIGALFAKLLRFLDSAKIDQLNRENLLKYAEQHILRERIAKESKEIFKEYMDVRSLDGNFPIIGEVNSHSLSNKTPVEIYDIVMPLYGLAASRISKYSTNFTYFPLSIEQKISKTEYVFYFETPKKIKLTDKLLVYLSIRYTSVADTQSRFFDERSKLTDQLKMSAQNGEMKTLSNLLSNISELYNLHYNTENDKANQ